MGFTDPFEVADIPDGSITDNMIASIAAEKIEAGTISVAIELLAALITGPHIRTAAAGKRIEIISSAAVDTIQWFDSTGALCGLILGGAPHALDLQGGENDLGVQARILLLAPDGFSEGIVDVQGKLRKLGGGAGDQCPDIVTRSGTQVVTFDDDGTNFLVYINGALAVTIPH